MDSLNSPKRSISCLLLCSLTLLVLVKTCWGGCWYPDNTWKDTNGNKVDPAMYEVECCCNLCTIKAGKPDCKWSLSSSQPIVLSICFTPHYHIHHAKISMDIVYYFLGLPAYTYEPVKDYDLCQYDMQCPIHPAHTLCYNATLNKEDITIQIPPGSYQMNMDHVSSCKEDDVDEMKDKFWTMKLPLTVNS